MEIKFLNSLPENYSEQPILISGSSSLFLERIQFLSFSQLDGSLCVYEIRYENQVGPFKQSMLFGKSIAIGHEEHFYLFNLTKNINSINLKLSGYFGHFYVNENLIYVADANDLYCLDYNGTIKWQAKDLGVDGVIINGFTESEIYGSGEIDPPGGWEDFTLDLKTGIKKHTK